MITSQKEFCERYDIDPQIGCLARCANTLPAPFDEWAEVAKRLPQFLASGTVREEVSRLTERRLEQPLLPDQARLLSRIATSLGAALIWGTDPPAASIPWPVAPVLVGITESMGMKPILSYAQFILWNWRLIDPSGPAEPENVELEQYFIPTEHARWFNAVHVAIEADAAPLPLLLTRLHYARIADDPGRMHELFSRCAEILERINAHLRRMPEHCEPEAYFRFVRPFIQGFHTHPVAYESFWDNMRKHFWGESGSQSLLIPALDCAFGIEHRSDGPFAPFAQYLREMPDYMPYGHRHYLHDLSDLTRAGEVSLFVYVIGSRRTHPELCEVFHRCAALLVEFSETHFAHAKSYIHDQAAQATAYNRADVGTGGTTFLDYLREHVQSRRRFAESLMG